MEILKSCCQIGDASLGREVHGNVIKRGFDSVGFVGNAVVSMYCKCDEVVGARKVFGRMLDREDLVLWSSIISGYGVARKPLETLRLFREMRSAGVDKNTFTFVAALEACEECSFKRSRMEIHALALKYGHVTNVYVANALVISGLLQNGHHSEACSCFREMQKEGKKLDLFTLTSVLTACGRLECLRNRRKAYAYTIKSRLDVALMVGNTLIDMHVSAIM